MSQSNAVNQNLPNGIPSHFNGMDSSHSSRDSSPSMRMYQHIPTSQLPPSNAIPANQLPPSRHPVNQLTQNFSNLHANHVTPRSSPVLQAFGTSTPQVAKPRELSLIPVGAKSKSLGGTVLSPIIPITEFTHSATSHFSNVPLSQAHADALAEGNVQGMNNNQAERAGQNQAQLASRGSVPTQNNTNVPLNIVSHVLQECDSSLLDPPATRASRPPLQPSLSQPRLSAYNPNPLNVLPVTSIPAKQPGIGNIQNVPLSRVQRSTGSTRSAENIHSLISSFPNTVVHQLSAASTPSKMSTPDMSPTHQHFSSDNTQVTSATIQHFLQPQAQNSAMSAKLQPVGQPAPTAPQPNYINVPHVSHVQSRPASGNVSPLTQRLMNLPRTDYPSNNSPNFQNKLPMNQGDMSAMNKPPTNPPLNGPQTGPFPNQGDASRYPKPPPTGPSGIPNRPPISKSMTVPPMMQQTTSQMSNYAFPHNPQTVNNQPPHNSGLNLYPAVPKPNSVLEDNAVFAPQQQNIPPVNPIRNNLHTNRYPNQQFNTNPIQQPQQSYQNVQQSYQNVQQPQQYAYQQQYPAAPQAPQVPQVPQPKPQQPTYNQNSYNSQPSVSHMGFNKMWGNENFDLLQCATILPPTKVETPQVTLGNELLDSANCQPDIFRCTMTKIPESNSLLQKSRLPLGVLIHPFRDLNHLPVIQCNTIVRCRACRTYINPFVFFVDNKRWKCNLCYRINELPEEFQYDPVTKTYGDPSRRPEVKTSTIEYIAPAEYMLRPPQPAVYLFLLDISRAAVESGYLHTVCSVLAAELPNLPGDARTHIGFIAYDSALHFFSLADGLSQPHEMTILDIDDVFLPCPDNLLVNLQDRMELISDLLAQLPNRFDSSYDTGSALGAALQAAHKMMASTGGRVTVFQASLPTVGPGALTSREDPSQRAGSDIQYLNPANDFYKRLALECSGQQIAVDIFLLNPQYIDVATISGISRFSGGCIYHFPMFKVTRQVQSDGFERSLKRYLTRKIGFEAVMRIRCTRGLSIHTFHGNFFVRSTDLLSLPNVNPDAGFGMQVAIEENLSDVQTVCFQAALLYTSSKGERRIRVHTMCLPVVNSLTDIINSADQQCIVGLLAKMAVDRSMQSSLADAREAFINVAIDILSSYKLAQNLGTGTSGLMAPKCLRLLPLYICAMLKHTAFRTGYSTRLDDRVKAMCDMKTRPLSYLIQQIYADLYPVHNLQDQATILNDEEEPVPMPPHLHLTARSIDSNGAYLLDMGEHMIIIVCPAVSGLFLNQVLGVPEYNSITEYMYELPILENEHNQRLHLFMNYLNEEKPMNATLQIIKDNSPLRGMFLEKLIEDRLETALSYHEFLQHLKTQVK